MTSEAEPSFDRKRSLGAVAATGLVMFGGVTPIYGIQFGLSVLIGALIAVGNLWATSRAVAAFIGGRGSVAWGVVAMFKFSGLIVGLYLLFSAGLVQGLPLLIGLGALPLGLVLTQLLTSSTREG